MNREHGSEYIRLTTRMSRGLFVFFFIIFSPLPGYAYELLLGTGEKGSFSHFTGKVICRVINQDSELSCKVIPAPDSSHNLTNIRSGALDVALVDSRMLHDAFQNSGYFKFFDITYDNLRILLPIYIVPIALVVRNDAKIRSLDDLKGKRFNAGAPLSVQRLAADNIMKAKGWTKMDFNPLGELSSNHAQDTLAFNGGTIQAMLHIGVHPDPILAHLLRRTKAALVGVNGPDIEKLIRSRNGFTTSTILAGTYPANVSDVHTIGTEVTLIASEDMDDSIVTAILAAIVKNKDYLKKAHPALAVADKFDTSTVSGTVPLHRAVINSLQR